MGNAAGDEPSLEEVVTEIRKIRLRRFFSLSDNQLDELSSRHESMLHYLYEIYRRYGGDMDERMKSAIVICLLSREADFEEVYDCLSEDAGNRDEVLNRFVKAERPRMAVYN